MVCLQSEILCVVGQMFCCPWAASILLGNGTTASGAHLGWHLAETSDLANCHQLRSQPRTRFYHQTTESETQSLLCVLGDAWLPGTNLRRPDFGSPKNDLTRTQH
jgi:hypothetical protein